MTTTPPPTFAKLNEKEQYEGVHHKLNPTMQNHNENSCKINTRKDNAK
jgi:hypothetical protein